MLLCQGFTELVSFSVIFMEVVIIIVYINLYNFSLFVSGAKKIRKFDSPDGYTDAQAVFMLHNYLQKNFKVIFLIS